MHIHSLLYPISDILLPTEQFGQAIGNPKFDWNFVTAPQSGLDNSVVSYPRGKMLGGSSGINFMAWDRASVKEYDAWQKVRYTFRLFFMGGILITRIARC